MYNNEELGIIGRARGHGFASYLCNEYGSKGMLDRSFNTEQLPDKDFFEKRYNHMKNKKSDFDITYLIELPEESVNPLKDEQEKWKNLSPRVGCFLDTLDYLIEEYDSVKEDCEGDRKMVSRVMNEWWELLQEWNALSNSYKVKVEMVYDALNERGIHNLNFEVFDK